MAAALTLGGGVLLGFASSLHCVGMCGGIALLMGLPGAGRWRDIGALHLGRTLAYVLMGGIAGGFGSLAFGTLTPGFGHLLLRWAAAMTLVWIGLATMGFMPSPAMVGHKLLSLAGGLARKTPMAAGGGMLAAGFGWGLMPCGMVYGALFYAAFAGSVPGGMAVMAGFALGTLPALLLVHSGSAKLAALARRPTLRYGAGVTMIGLAMVSLLPPEADLLGACLSLAGRG